MKEPVLANQTNRREMLKLSALGVLGGVVASAPLPQSVRAAEPPAHVAYESWIHGHTMQIEYPERILSQSRMGFYMHVEGTPGTLNWFHFAIPTPVIINDVRLRAHSVMLCFQTGSEDAIVRDVHVYDGVARIAVHDNLNLSKANTFVRCEVPNKPEVWYGLGISVGVTFGANLVADHSMDFSAAGCDFILQPSA